MKSMVSRAVYKPFGSNRSSNRDSFCSRSWNTSGPQSYLVTTDRVGSRWTHQHVYARATSSQIGNHQSWWTYQIDTPSWNRSGQSCPNVCARFWTRDQTVSTEIDQPWSYRIHAQQNISERIRIQALNFNEIPRSATNGQVWHSQRIARQSVGTQHYTISSKWTHTLC